MSRQSERVPRPKRTIDLVLSRGRSARVVRVRGWAMATASLAAATLIAWAVGATAYVLFRDDVLGAMMARQTRMQHAYEDRIAALRLQVDRITSRQLLDQEQFQARLDELLRRQATLDGRAQAMQGVLERAQRLGVVPAAAGAVRADAAGDPGPAAVAPAPPARPEASLRGLRIGDSLDRVDGAIGALATSHEQALVRIETQAREQEARIGAVVAGLGIDADRLAGPRPRPAARASGVGGPLVPLSSVAAQTALAFEQRAAAVVDQLAYLDRLKRGLSAVPLRRPVQGEPDISSGFGPRRDPFLGVMAMHQGMDFRGATGDPVRAAAAGAVTTARRNGGFGIMVEIDHGHGLVTRYAHLSALAVREGQTVTAGQIVGRVGSTGRSTGPHLHYETWIGEQAVNPERFMRAGQRLGLW